MRIMSLVLALALCLSMPMQVLAAEVIEPESPIEVTEVVEEIESTESSSAIEIYAEASTDYLRVIAGCVVFFTVVLLCHFSYKFLRIFF